MNDASNESPSGIRQIYRPRRLQLARLKAAGGAGGVVAFRVEVPDSRLHWKLSVIGVGSVPGAQLLAGRQLKIWIAALEDDCVRGGLGVPVTDIKGTSATPDNFPADQAGAYDTALGGVSVENEGAAADAILGVITIPAQGARADHGGLYLQCRYQPNVGHFIAPPEWEEIKAACEPSLIDGGVVDT